MISAHHTQKKSSRKGSDSDKEKNKRKLSHIHRSAFILPEEIFQRKATISYVVVFNIRIIFRSTPIKSSRITEINKRSKNKRKEKDHKAATARLRAHLLSREAKSDEKGRTKRIRPVAPAVQAVLPAAHQEIQVGQIGLLKNTRGNQSQDQDQSRNHTKRVINKNSFIHIKAPHSRSLHLFHRISLLMEVPKISRKLRTIDTTTNMKIKSFVKI